MAKAERKVSPKQRPSARPVSTGPGRVKLRKGVECATIWTPPRRTLTPKTSLGYECIQFAEEVLEVKLFPWQKWFLIHALEINPDGRFRFRTVLLLVGRQNGKSTLLQVYSLWRMYVDGAPLILGTAQNLDVAEEQWSAAVEIAESNDELAAEIADVKRTNGKYALKLESGQRYKVAAASRKGGRGMSGDLILMDELREHSNWDSWSAVTKTTMARKRAQVLCASNAGDAASVVLRAQRNKCLQALRDGDTDKQAMGIFEWSAMVWKEHPTDPFKSEWKNLPTSDRTGWAMANPSLEWGEGEESGLTWEALEAAYNTDPDPVFRTECLCQWVTTAKGGAFEDGLWESLKDLTSARTPGGEYIMGLDVEHDGSSATIVVAAFREDGLVHGESIASRTGTAWVKDWFLESAPGTEFPRKDNPAFRGVAIQKSGAPASALIEELVKAGVNVIEWGGTELGIGTQQFYNLVRNKELRHRGQEILDVAVSMAATKPLGDVWVWDRRKSLVGIAALVALTAATWALRKPPENPPESAYDNEEMMFV